MRADAARNRERILVAARDLVAERGPGVPLDEVARHAGVGVATLYRRYPDRTALLEAVVLHCLQLTTQAARRARAEADDPWQALTRYLREALELRVSAVIPAVLGVVDLGGGELERARTDSAEAVEALVDEAHAAGCLAEDVTFADIGTMLVRIARPLLGPLTEETKHALARRHLELFLRALTPEGGAAGSALPEPALTRHDLPDLTEEES
jgi:AcrR family transcriptional regulator